MSAQPFVVAGSIVRNRAWVLERHLESLFLQQRPPDAFFYVYGDCTDNTEQVLRTALNPHYPHVVSPSLLRHDTGEPGYTRDASDGPRYRSEHMAAERNLWAEEALKRWPSLTHLFVVDSDVLPEPDVLEKLLALKAPVAAAFVPLQDGRTPIAMMGWDGAHNRPARTGEEALLTKPHVATLVGGAYLIQRWVLDEAYRQPGFNDHEKDRLWLPLWGEHAQGEDGHFAKACQIHYATMLHHPGARCRHLMERDDR